MVGAGFILGRTTVSQEQRAPGPSSVGTVLSVSDDPATSERTRSAAQEPLVSAPAVTPGGREDILSTDAVPATNTPPRRARRRRNSRIPASTSRRDLRGGDGSSTARDRRPAPLRRGPTGLNGRPRRHARVRRRHRAQHARSDGRRPEFPVARLRTARTRTRALSRPRDTCARACPPHDRVTAARGRSRAPWSRYSASGHLNPLAGTRASRSCSLLAARRHMSPPSRPRVNHVDLDPPERDHFVTRAAFRTCAPPPRPTSAAARECKPTERPRPCAPRRTWSFAWSFTCSPRVQSPGA